MEFHRKQDRAGEFYRKQACGEESGSELPHSKASLRKLAGRVTGLKSVMHQFSKKGLSPIFQKGAFPNFPKRGFSQLCAIALRLPSCWSRVSP
jgi:hypothetical protein